MTNFSTEPHFRKVVPAWIRWLFGASGGKKLIKNIKNPLTGAVVAGIAALAVTGTKAQGLTLRGASLFDNDYA